MAAAWNNNAEAVKALIEAGAEKDLQDEVHPLPHCPSLAVSLSDATCHVLGGAFWLSGGDVVTCNVARHLSTCLP